MYSRVSVSSLAALKASTDVGRELCLIGKQGLQLTLWRIYEFDIMFRCPFLSSG